MNVGDVVLIGFVLVLIVVVLAVCILYLVPFPVKADFDATCRKYLFEMVSSGGLTAAEVATLRTELIDAGFLNINIDSSIQGTVKLGDELHFEVTATFEKAKISLFSTTTEQLPFVYKKYVANRKVVQ
jgi:hypothetical protein